MKKIIESLQSLIPSKIAKEEVNEIIDMNNRLKDNYLEIAEAISFLANDSASMIKTVNEINNLTKLVDELIQNTDGSRHAKRKLLKRVFDELSKTSITDELRARDEDEDIEFSLLSTRRTFDSHYNKMIKTLSSEIVILQEAIFKYLSKQTEILNGVKNKMLDTEGDPQ